MSAQALRPVPGPSIDPQADSLQTDCERWIGLQTMIGRLNDQAAEIADRIVAAAGDTGTVDCVDATGEPRTIKVVRVPIRTVNREALEAAIPKPVYRSVLADPTVDRERLAAAVKLGQIDPRVLADVTTVTYRRPYLRVSTVKR